MMGEVIRVSGRTPDVGEFLREAMLSQRFADVALCCPGGQRFLAHRLVLSAASPYLQEVLLAHSRTSTTCEPITVILAEVEAPELAAILGFVYTGTATVPRPRLNAFLHAAEALHIRLPPVPVVMTATSSPTDCKQEDAKDVKISPTYLRCDQYPCCERSWHRPRSRDPDAEAKMPGKRPPRPIEPFAGSPREIGPESSLPDSMNFAVARYDPAGYWPVPAFVGEERIVDPRIDKPEQNRHADVRRYHAIDRINLPDAGNALNVCDPTRQQWPPQERLRSSRSSSDAHARHLDHLEIRMRSERDACYEGCEEEEETEAEVGDRSRSRSYEHCCEQERLVAGRLSVIRPRIVPCPSKIASVQTGPSRIGPCEKNLGEDLSCQQDLTCFGWKSTRRHVANRVIASPWRQTVRPYHLPKLQPIVLQPHADDCEPGENLRAPEAAQVTTMVTSPASGVLVKNAASTENYYGVEVPSNQGIAYNDAPRPMETNSMEAMPTVPDFYPPQIPLATPTPQQIVPTVIGDVLRNTETISPAQSNVIFTATKSGTNASDGNNRTNVNRNANGNVRQTLTQKPEISHPVSRLCDTIESNDKPEARANLEVETLEKSAWISAVDPELAERIVLSSDDNNNNNDAIVSQEIGPRGKSQENHRCDQCGKTFVTRASLKVHIRTHSGEKPFRCTDCGKQFSQLRNYKYHRSVHEGTREFAATCPECGKYFNDRGYLSSHMKIHRNRKEYGCAECGKSFNQRVAYNMHVRIHTGVKPHQCEQCGKAFSRKMLLKQHLRTHSGERPYQCQVCQKAFADRSNMTLHTRLHSGLKPYQCTLCSKAFTKKHHLKTHLNYHTGTKPYACPNCGLRFSQSSNMRTHFKKCTVNNNNNNNNNQTAEVNGAHQDAANHRSPLDASKSAGMRIVSRTPTDVLTPPNSDQELTMLTPICSTGIAVAEYPSSAT